MATFAPVAADRQYVVGLVSSYTIYNTYEAARAAAQTLSASNSSAAVYTAQVVCAATAGTLPRVDQYPCTVSPTNLIVQLASTADYYPQATAIAQAFTTSAANSNGQTFVAWIQDTCTGP